MIHQGDDKIRCRFLSLLVLMILNLTICSFSFAQTDAANAIIEDRIDELWTTGKLQIGLANVASKHWLPQLYKRSNFKLLWQNPENISDLLADIGRIAEDGLDPEDYHLSQLLVLILEAVVLLLISRTRTTTRTIKDS